MKQATAMTLFLLAVFIAVLLLVAAMIAFVCSRPPRMPQFTPRVWYTPNSSNNDPETRLGHGLGRPPSYASSLSCQRNSSFFIMGSGTGMPQNASESFKNDMISVSPSKPVMVGGESVKGGVSMKLMVTPPTPSKTKLERESALGDLSLDFSCDSDGEGEGVDSEDTVCASSKETM